MSLLLGLCACLFVGFCCVSVNQRSGTNKKQYTDKELTHNSNQQHDQCAQ